MTIRTYVFIVWHKYKRKRMATP